jgi:hypothetical protein
VPTNFQAEWMFNVKNSFSKGRDPVQGEFFNDEDIKDVSVALIRESFQNSLDSHQGGKIRIRVTVSGDANALTPATAAKYFGSYWDHLKGAYPSNRVEISEMARKKCEFLVIEDFGTTGLTGDERAEDEPDDKKNDFFYFFRAEGKSGKSGNNKGRWGIGKYVFPKSSAAKAFFALTIRSGGTHRNGPLLMGQAVIKGHKVGTTSYEPDGYFAIKGERVFEPFDASEIIDEFKHDWRISRVNESGLSVVVPYIEDVNEGDLFRSVVEEYMLVILRNELEVELVGSDGVVHLLDSNNLREEAERIFLGRDEKDEVLENLDLLVWALSAPTAEVIELNQVDSSPEWNTERISEEHATLIRERIDSLGKAIVRIPVKVRVNRADAVSAHDKESHFDVIYVSSPGSIRAQFVREGIRVSGVQGGKLNSLRAIVLIDDGILATLLGDAEGPAHTDWSKDSEKLGRKYLYEAKWIEFVKKAPRKIIETARGADREGDRSIAAGWFPDVTAGNTPVTGRGIKNTGETTDPPPPPPPPPSKPKVRMSEIDGGFSLTLTEHGQHLTGIRCISAYDTRKGDPFRKWTLDDFDVKKLNIELAGGTVTEKQNNSIDVKILDPKEFFMHVRGFDVNRDVATTIRFEENSEAAE